MHGHSWFPRGILVQLVLQEMMVMLEQLGLRDQLGQEGNEVKRVQLDHKGRLVQLDHKVILELKA
jgi:protoporphyrinogen oxidase